ncbi:helveticin J family class III bacteriocin [Lactobacillus helveticus]|uniref:Bacteriocin helveticin-J n=2 Tax=Lactobacillus helveticus TaxID=1587 RepID=A0A9Q5G8D9_LACHE|nr:helveticin J family class III bacteriocin [Lactobacillus helveticus]NRN79438.1 hypothetical protein [Lactobacillus helveticus]NRN92180.1 hypothetical protein [Lactobacillus helveticus]NRN96508.1 hypothetical protein [Lactobacillus helveticus]NRO39046.1 hypothetical protein [Lactobacillus helveticus]NRO48654.1 hypothetical protein [Lactobacillus helveticus]
MVNIREKYDLKGLHQVVVQKGNVGGKYIYALQLLTQGTDAVVYRASKGEKFKKGTGTKRVYLYGPKTPNINPKQTAGGHTQTWEYAGTPKQGNDNADWFIGTKSKKEVKTGIVWDTQIARIPFGKHAKLNTELPRISNLNQAGRKFGLGYDGDTMVRSEAAVSPSPNYSYFLIATVDSAGTGYFSVYNLTDVNSALNSHGTSDVNLKKDDLANLCLRSFKIKDFITDIGSIQGYDIDDNLNIYISSEAHPNKTHPIESKTRKIVKIPWGETDPTQWDIKNLDGYSELDEPGYATEFEGIQVNGENDLYLTVAYHNKSNYTTEKNKIFQVTW